ncbi:MAG: hypothetical protein C0473_01185 [Cyanobacteria bacterium DS3.002]|nr:hypothetical protein [Cyanobacteria bacterium DS3.002]
MQAANQVDTANFRSLYARLFWNIERHELIAASAERLLTPATRNKVLNILSVLGTTSMSQQAGWLDRVRRMQPNPNQDAETRSFLENPANQSNDRWHYVNLPLGVQGYDRVRYPQFTREDDVVQITLSCIKVLQGNSDRFSLVNALRVLIHVVEDLHQPIHCACGYIDNSGNQPKFESNPQIIIAKNLESDRGGNSIILPIAGSVRLHGYWDGAFDDGNQIAATDNKEEANVMKEALVATLSASIENEPSLASGDDNDILAWPVKWVNQSLVEARKAYQSLVITGKRPGAATAYDVTWEGQDEYDNRCRPIVHERIASATANLALVLNSIFV